MVFRLARKAGVNFLPMLRPVFTPRWMTDTGSFMFQGTE